MIFKKRGPCKFRGFYFDNLENKLSRDYPGRLYRRYACNGCIMCPLFLGEGPIGSHVQGRRGHVRCKIISGVSPGMTTSPSLKSHGPFETKVTWSAFSDNFRLSRRLLIPEEGVNENWEGLTSTSKRNLTIRSLDFTRTEKSVLGVRKKSHH